MLLSTDTLLRYRAKNGNLYVQLFVRGPLVRVPKLSGRQRDVLGRLMELGCGAVEQRPWGSEQGRSALTGVLRALIKRRLIEVMEASPARYRVSELGRIALRG